MNICSTLEAYKPKCSQLEPLINVNDICILRNELAKWAFWNVCKIIEPIVGADRSIRSARVEAVSKKESNIILTRSLKQWIPLEVRSKPLQQITQQPALQASSQTVVKSCSRPRQLQFKNLILTKVILFLSFKQLAYSVSYNLSLIFQIFTFLQDECTLYLPSLNPKASGMTCVLHQLAKKRTLLWYTYVNTCWMLSTTLHY